MEGMHKNPGHKKIYLDLHWFCFVIPFSPPLGFEPRFLRIGSQCATNELADPFLIEFRSMPVQGHCLPLELVCSSVAVHLFFGSWCQLLLIKLYQVKGHQFLLNKRNEHLNKDLTFISSTNFLWGQDWSGIKDAV